MTKVTVEENADIALMSFEDALAELEALPVDLTLDLLNPSEAGEKRTTLQYPTTGRLSTVNGSNQRKGPGHWWFGLCGRQGS